MDPTTLFFATSKDYMVQTMCGVYMASHHQFKNFQLGRLLVLTAFYLNGCYHSYFRKDDQYITKTFQKIFTETSVKNVVCFLHWVLFVSHHIYEEMDPMLQQMSISSTGKDPNSLRTLLQGLIAKAYDDLVVDFKEKGEIKCCGKLETTYDGKDLFTF